MKRLVQLLLVLLLSAQYAYSQVYEKPADGKSLVYFVRFSGVGALINFKYFDAEKYLGKMNGVNYFTYECDPGKHIFWVASENRDYVTADLKPNATYIVEVRPTMGAFKAAVQVHPIAPDDAKTLKKVNKVLAKNSPAQLHGKDEDMAFFIKTGMERYEKIKTEVPSINPEWTF
jgi:hypothetical protein